LEFGQRLLEKRGRLVRRALRLEVGAEHAFLDPAAELADAIARTRRALDERTHPTKCPGTIARLEQDVDQLQLDCAVDLAGGNERERALEQVHGGGVVEPELGTVAGGR